jgi:HSP20 family protein
MELPGVRPEDVDIRITGGVLTIRGEKREEKEEKNKNLHFTERSFGSFQRSVQLPSTVDPDKVEATFKNGVLTVTVAKHADAKPKRIKVRNA